MPDYQAMLEKALARKVRQSKPVPDISNSPCEGSADEVEDWSERAAIMEYDGGLSRESAEHAATIICLDKYRNNRIT